MIRDFNRIENAARAAMADMRFGEPAPPATRHAGPAGSAAIVAVLAALSLAVWLLLP